MQASEPPLNAWIRALQRVAPYGRGAGSSLPAIVAGVAASFGEKPALLCDGECLTYAGLARRMAQYARWALQQQLAAGDVVCLLLPNCPDYVAIWLGIISVRGVVALINTNLGGDALLHAITAVGPKHIIAGGGLAAALSEIADRLQPGVQIWGHRADDRWQRIDEHAAGLCGESLRHDEQRPPALTDLALHIYTSGTTGLPKAANVSHRRIAEWSCWFAGMIDTQPDDRMYNCLPMYHSVGGIVAIGAMLAGGASVLIRPKFSASQFWNEIVAADCTLFQYIGELCRYLVNSPPNANETRHRLRLCCGNGLRGDVWEPFRTRFNIPRILEFYASTEGNVSLYNCEGRPGSIGRVPSILAHRFPVALVRCDSKTGALIRDAAGLCIICAHEEPGEALGRVGNSATTPGRPFEGYTDAAASAKKIARNVLVPGDSWFRTGDLMRRDAAGFYYFIDRIGDNFRWKGENIASEEVANVLRACPGVLDAIVYGVTVPGCEGRACMAALIAGDAFDLTAFRQYIATHLPDYARPMFLRLASEFAVTGTFKPAKGLLIQQGYDPNLTADPLYTDHPATDAFVRVGRDEGRPRGSAPWTPAKDKSLEPWCLERDRFTWDHPEA